MSAALMSTADLAAMLHAVQSMSSSAEDAERIERVGLFEQLKAALAAAQAVETAAFVASQRAAQAAAGVPADRQSRGVAAQIALARRISPHAAQRYIGWAGILVRELPGTFAQLRAGRTSEWRAMIVARETIFLSRADRAVLDRDLAPRLAALSDRAVETETRSAAYRLDPEGFLARSRAAAGDRRVSIRPAPDTMCRLSGLLPVAQGVAAYAALVRAADTGRATGDPRSRGQVMADTFVERLTGQTAADEIPVEVELVVSVDTLLPDDTSTEHDTSTEFGTRTRERTGDEPAHVTAPGLAPMPVPAGIARDLLAHAPQAWLRRLFTAPATGALVSMETPRRLFTATQRDFIRHRDQYCATPWCGAPVRHADHVTAALDGGATHLDNARGLCEACNHAHQAPGWRSRTRPDGIETITPTGHRYLHRRPAPPGPRTAVRPRTGLPPEFLGTG